MENLANVVHWDVHLNDCRQMTAISIKVKGCDGFVGHKLVATTLVAFSRVTLLADEDATLMAALNPRRKNIVNAMVKLPKGNSLAYRDVASFVEAFQSALDSTVLPI